MPKGYLLTLTGVLLGVSLAGVSGQTKSASAEQAKATPARVVKGQILDSADMPAVRLKFDDAFRYVGSQEFILYEVARAEQHFFLDADKEGRIRRMYWVQFEGYLPTNTRSYNYRLQQRVNLGGLEFIADSAARKIETGGRPDSDGARARAFLAGKGYRMASDDVLWQRLVHLVDEARRNELMVIYLEDLSPTNCPPPISRKTARLPRSGRKWQRHCWNVPAAR
jgi:hypothetical protein